jgi:AcrR family transcriptional regulator
MSKADQTKQDLARRFIDLMGASSFSSISVARIIESCCMNRKTFYYHFKNKEDLVIWIYRRDIAGLLSGAFSPEQLVGHGPTGNPMNELASLPYYIHVESGVRSLDNSAFVCILTEYLFNHREYYSKLLACNSFLGEYLFKLYRHELRCDIDFMLSGRHLADADKDFLADFSTSAMLAHVIRTSLQTRPASPRFGTDTRIYQNIVHESLKAMIESRPLPARVISR